MAQPPELPVHLREIKNLLDGMRTKVDLALVNSYIVERAKQQQTNSRAEHMAQFQPGDRVSFNDKHGQLVKATVVRLNKKNGHPPE